MADQSTIGGLITWQNNNPGHDQRVTLSTERTTPSGKAYREGETGEFVSGGDTRGKIRFLMFANGTGVVAGQVHTVSSRSGDLVHTAVEVYDQDGKILFSAPKGAPWKAPGRKIYPRDGRVAFDDTFTFSPIFYELAASFKTKTWG